MKRDTLTNKVELDACRRLAAIWAPVLRALGSEERLLIALWLAGTECSVRDLERVTGMKQSLVSYHLQALRTAGLISMSSVGRSNRYRLAGSDLDELATLLGRLDAGAV